jgi:hypothetical protein
MARMEQADLAAQAEVSVDTIKRLERTVGPISANVTTMAAVVRVLEAAGVEFTNGNQPGVRPRLPDSYTDTELLKWLDQDHLWIVRGIPNPLPANAKTLRAALVSARKLQTSEQAVTSIRSIGERIIIPSDQIQRLWSHLQIALP